MREKQCNQAQFCYINVYGAVKQKDFPLFYFAWDIFAQRLSYC